MKKHTKINRLLLLFALVVLIFVISSSVFAGKDKTTPDPITTEMNINQTMIDNLKSKLTQYGTTNTATSALAGEMINWQVIGSGATNGSSTNFHLLGTVGQTAVGKSSSANFQINHGFWQTFSTSSDCCDNPGDANNDGIIGISDLTYFVDYMFNAGQLPICSNEFDNNADCILGISDLTYFVDYMFNSGPPPVCGCVD